MTKEDLDDINSMFLVGEIISDVEEVKESQPDLFTRKHRYKKDINIIFLDIDGVLNYCPPAPSNSYNCKFPNGEEIEPKIIKKFNKVFDKYPELKIVVSSSWRGNMKKVVWALRIAGFNYIENIIGYTPRAQAIHYKDGDITKPLEPPFTILHERRGQQILKWLLDHPGIQSRINKFLIIDDETNDICGKKGFEFLKENTLQTNPDTGLTHENIQFIIDYFISGCECENIEGDKIV